MPSSVRVPSRGSLRPWGGAYSAAAAASLLGSLSGTSLYGTLGGAPSPDPQHVAQSPQTPATLDVTALLQQLQSMQLAHAQAQAAQATLPPAALHQHMVGVSSPLPTGPPHDGRS